MPSTNLINEEKDIEEKQEKAKLDVVSRLYDIDTEEVSVVDKPANNRKFLLIKRQEEEEEIEKQGAWAVGGDKDLSLNEEKDWDAAAAEQRLRKWAGGPDKEELDFDKYRRAFVVWNTEDPNNFGSYKLPFADVVDGKLVAVRKGLIAVRQVLEGARGGVNLSEELIEKAKSFVNSYLGKPEEKQMDKDNKEETKDTEKELEKNSDQEQEEKINDKGSDEDVEKVGSKMQETRLNRLKSAIKILKDALIDLQNGSPSMDKFQKASAILNTILSEVSKGINFVVEEDSEDRSGDDLSAPNMGSGLMKDEELAQSFKEFFSKMPELQSVIKSQKENKKALEELKKSIEDKDESIKNKDSEIEKLREEINKLKNYRSAPSGSVETQPVEKREDDQVVWSLDLAKELERQRK